MRKSSATVVFLPLYSRDAKEERETAVSVEETAAMARAREHTRERERGGRACAAPVRACLPRVHPGPGCAVPTRARVTWMPNYVHPESQI